MLASLTLLTPLGALVIAAVVLPLAAIAEAARRLRATRAALGLRPPAPAATSCARGARRHVRPACACCDATGSVTRHRRAVRKDAQALFVLDTSRSMAAAASKHGADPARTREGRGDNAPSVDPGRRGRRCDPHRPRAARTCSRSPIVPSFDATVRRSVGIEEPPPRSTSLRATTFSALGAIPSSGFFASSAKKRAIVVLTDGESNPFDPSALGRSLAGTGVVVVHIGNTGESVFGRSGRPETGVSP